jgi:hypothetical protein
VWPANVVCEPSEGCCSILDMDMSERESAQSPEGSSVVDCFVIGAVLTRDGKDKLHRLAFL